MGAKWSAVPVVVLLLAVVAGCGLGAPDKGAAPEAGGHALFGEPLDEQFHAARRTTTEAGNAHFVSTLVYGSPKGDIVAREEGQQDYLADSATVLRSFRMPDGHPDGLLDELSEGFRTSKRNIVVTDEDVYYRPSSGRWLRYSADASVKFGKMAKDFMHDNAWAPWSVPMSVVLTRQVARHAPKVLPDGTRRYTETMAERDASLLLPQDLQVQVPGGARAGLTARLTVYLDVHGRFRRATADLGAALQVLKKHNSQLEDITTLRAEYTLSGFGLSSPAGLPAGAAVDDAEKSLQAIQDVKPGACGSTDTGLKGDVLVRPVDCGKQHDLRVFGHGVLHQLNLEDATEDESLDMALDMCGAKFRELPDSWAESGTDFYARLDLFEKGEAPGEQSPYTCYFLTS